MLPMGPFHPCDLLHFRKCGTFCWCSLWKSCTCFRFYSLISIICFSGSIGRFLMSLKFCQTLAMCLKSHQTFAQCLRMPVFCMFSCIITQFGPIKVLANDFFQHVERKHPAHEKKELLFPRCGRHHSFNIPFHTHSAPMMEGWSGTVSFLWCFKTPSLLEVAVAFSKCLGPGFCPIFFCRVSGLVFCPSAKHMEDILKCDWQQKRIRKKKILFLSKNFCWKVNFLSLTAQCFAFLMS